MSPEMEAAVDEAAEDPEVRNTLFVSSLMWREVDGLLKSEGFDSVSFCLLCSSSTVVAMRE